MAIPARRSHNNGVQRFSFGAFQVSEPNRPAFEACCDVANLREIRPQPIVLTGPQGAGKTHLLYAIANRVRQLQQNVGLVCVSANSFPEQARLLAADSEPLHRARRALLLVDQLDRFQDPLIEQLIHAFVDSGHTVIITAREHPAQWDNCSEEFRAEIGRGSSFSLQPRSANGRANGNGSAQNGSKHSLSPPAAKNAADAGNSWNAVRSELNRAYKELRWALDEVERLREDNRAMAERAAAVEHDGNTSDFPQAGLLEKAESILLELHANREQFEALQASQRAQIDDLRRVGMEEPTRAAEPAEPSDLSHPGEDELEHLRQSLAHAREERELDRARLRRAHVTIDRQHAELARLRSEDTAVAPSHATGNPADAEGESESGPAKLTQPLADLEDAARCDESDTESEAASQATPGSSVYHVEQLNDEPDFFDDGDEDRDRA